MTKGTRIRAMRCGCGKRFYGTEAAARQAERSISSIPGVHQAPVRFYQCHLKSWHWTRKDPEQPNQKETP